MVYSNQKPRSDWRKGDNSIFKRKRGSRTASENKDYTKNNLNNYYDGNLDSKNISNNYQAVNTDFTHNRNLDASCNTPDENYGKKVALTDTNASYANHNNRHRRGYSESRIGND